MRKIYMNSFILVLLFSFTTGHAQTLSAGDVAITGYISSQSGVTDRVSLVLLKAVPSGEAFKLTDNGWTGSAFNSTNKEGCVRINTTSALSIGTELTIVFTSGAPVVTLSSGTATVTIITNATYFGGDVPDLAAAGDQLLVYRGGEGSPTFITGIHTSNALIPSTTNSNWDGQSLSSSQSDMPTGLTGGLNALWLSNGQSLLTTVKNGRINCASGDYSSVAIAKLALFNLANWTRVTTTGAEATFTLPTGCLFLAPFIATHPSAFAGCAGLPVSFTVAANGSGLSYQWQEDDSSAFLSPTNLTNTGIYSNTSTTTLNISDNTSVDGMYYRCVVSNVNGSVNSNGVLLTITPFTLPTAYTSVNHDVSAFNNLFYDASCRLLAKVVPSGINPVSGIVSVTTWREGSVLEYNYQPYLQRHFQITPAIVGSTETAIVTLYFSQADFDNFNSHPESDYNLPTGPADASGKANLKIIRYYVNTPIVNNPLGLPGLYTAGFSGMDPLDTNIIFNATFSRWEVSFNVTGFGGFIIFAFPSVYTPLVSCTGLPQTMTNFNVPPFFGGSTFPWEESTDSAFSNWVVLDSGGVYNITYDDYDNVHLLTITDNTGLNGRFYRRALIEANDPYVGPAFDYLGPLTILPTVLPQTHVVETHLAGTNNNLSYAPGCVLISKIVPIGGTPVNGNITSEVWREPSAIIYGGQPFVQRHYQITPAAGSAAMVTLYFSQSEFDNFNADPASILNLPANAADAVGKANLRVYKYAGNTNNGTGLPGSYASDVTLIDPVDINILWNGEFNHWEVKFEVSGFSGFFIGTSDELHFCPGSTVTLTANLSGAASYQWQINTGTGFTDLTNGGNYSGTGTANLVISNTQAAFYNYSYRCIINNSFIGPGATIKPFASWTGNSSNDWENPLNWGCSVVPDSNTDVFIDNNLSRYPVVNNNTTIRSLTVSPGASIIVASGFNLLIQH